MGNNIKMGVICVAQTGYGNEIVRIIDALSYEKLIRTEEIAEQLAQRLSIPYDKARTAVNVKLKRIADSGEIKRVRKGVYYRVKQTVFGPVPPDIDRLIAGSVMIENGVRIGYESGAGFLNRLGLSTLIPREIEITTNQYRFKLPADCHIRLLKPAAAVTDHNWKYLQFIDAADRLPTAHVDAEAPERLMKSLAEKRGLDPLTLIFTARKYYSPKTVLRLTDLLMEGNNESAPG